MPSELELQLLTHHALGELPPARLSEVERLLAADPAAQAWVDEVRETAASLTDSLGREAMASAGLDAARRVAITAQAVRRPLRYRRWLVLAGGLAAAGLAVVLSVPAFASRQMRHPDRDPLPVASTLLPANGDGLASTRPDLARRPPPAQPDVEVMPIASCDLPVAAVSREEACDVVPKGRERAATEVEMGGVGSFTTVGTGAGRWSGRKAPAAVPGEAPSAKPVAGLFGWRSGADKKAGVPPQPPVPGGPVEAAGERYAQVTESSFQDPQAAPLSTFGLDVDTASYANVRRFLEQGRLPPPEAVRIEEMLNAFTYADPPPEPGSDRPFTVRVEVADCPWAPAHRLARIAVAAQAVGRGQRPPCNLVFLVDVSGSMGEAKKLSLVKTSLAMLTRQLRAEDRVAIVTYSDTTRVALASTPGSEAPAIIAAVEALAASGSTNGAAGIQLAYRTAQANAVTGVNRVVLCTDGDFNVGVQSRQELLDLIAEKRRSGITLTVLGYGMGNLKDANLQVLADNGNGTYAYIDSEAEAHTALVEQLDGHLVMVAKDAKVQVEFNPARVASWRLIGYEKRRLAARDFADDRVDSGDVGAGAHVTALYELETRPSATALPEDGLRYQAPAVASAERWDAELMFVKLRWKRPDLGRSELLRFPVVDRGGRYRSSSADFRFAAAVAAFGLVLRQSPHRGAASLALADELARSALADDGRRHEFLRLVRRAAELE